ncbi:Transcription termination factor, mitochondrial/chloroplastic [Dillenia turbinata]|uniref:Transcription termination factor, mitochondrial/chloroplastic n=1 Tax=Dillenia turbinata TaxID=194707 RepID=A0AAN8VZA6_9MAGN
MIVELDPGFKIVCTPSRIALSDNIVKGSSYDTYLFLYSQPDFAAAGPNILMANVSFQNPIARNIVKGSSASILISKKWELHSTKQVNNIALSDEEKKTWESCRQALSAFEFSVQEDDKILGKAYGQLQSPYWGEERKREVPKLEVVHDILDYLRSLSLSDNDLCKLLKKFPEVLGCNLTDEIKTNVQILEDQWGIKGKPLRNLLLRNPKVLGYNLDCKGVFYLGEVLAAAFFAWIRLRTW